MWRKLLGILTLFSFLPYFSICQNKLRENGWYHILSGQTDSISREPIVTTKDFIALSTMRYSHWEDFAAKLDEPLGQFIKIYRPNCFDRVGLRFVNAISREQLGLTGRRWNDLLQPPYLGILDEDDVDEASVAKCSVDVERKLDALAALKLHAGPGFVQRNIRSGNQVQQVQEKEVRFIFDQDVYSTGKVKVAAVAETLNALHAHSDSVFSDAITTVLHDAMEPEYL